MVHPVNFVLFWYPTVLAVECHRNFGFQISLPLFLSLLRRRHNAFSVPKRMRYNKRWDIVFDTTYGTLPYSVSHLWHCMNATCSIIGRFWYTNLQ